MSGFSRKIDCIVMTKTYYDQKQQIDKSEVEKLEQAIDVHGYRGQSKMKHNGVVNIKPDDKELWKSLKKFYEIEKNNIDQYIDENKLIRFDDVKIVAHCPNGDRSIGILYKDKSEKYYLILLGFSNYNYQLF